MNNSFSTLNKKTKYRSWGCLSIIFGVILTIGPFSYYGGTNLVFFGVFLIVIGVCLLLAASSSKSGGTAKRSYTTGSRIKTRGICPKCGAKSPFKTIGTFHCFKCGYKYSSGYRQIPSISDKKERNGQISLSWLKYQYYDLERSIQDIADELNVSMMTIRKLLDRIEAIPKKEEVKSTTDFPTFKTEEEQPIPPISDLLESKETSKPIPSISELKTEEIQTTPSISEKKVEKSFRFCSQCGQKLPLGAKFCVTCGQKVEVLKPIPLVIEIKEEIPQIAPAEELQPTPPVIEVKEEIPQIAPAEEIQPIQPVLEKKEEKRKLKPRVCKFCGMRIPKNKSFCLQCGMIIKSN